MSGHLMRAPAAEPFTRPGRGGRVRLRPSAAMGRWLMLLVALTGLMAMHGLSDHGVGGISGMTAVASAAAHATDGHAGHGASGPVQVEVADVSSTTGTGAATHQGSERDASGGHDGHGELMLGLCLAVLAAALLLLALVGAFRPLGTHLTELVDRAAAAIAALRARARGPACPDLKFLSIQRC